MVGAAGRLRLRRRGRRIFIETATAQLDVRCTEADLRSPTRLTAIVLVGMVAVGAASGMVPAISPGSAAARLVWRDHPRDGFIIVRSRFARASAIAPGDLASALSAVTQRLRLAVPSTLPRIVEVESLSDAAALNGGFPVPGLLTPAGDIILVGPLANQVLLRHELAHAVLRGAWGAPHDSSAWINEGLATVAAGGCGGYSALEVAAVLDRLHRLPTLGRLISEFRALPNLEAYLAAGSVVEWLEVSGRSELVRILWGRGAHALGPLDEAQIEWITYIRSAARVPWQPGLGCVRAPHT